MALRGAEGTPEGSGRTSGGALKKKSKRGGETIFFGESTITFWVFRTIPRGFLCVLTTPRRTQFSTLETKMRKSFGKKRPYDLLVDQGDTIDI
jgi:hypothetical protein